MPKLTAPKTTDEVILSILAADELITDKLFEINSLLNEFPSEWLPGIEANYKQFFDYCNSVIKIHQESKK